MISLFYSLYIFGIMASILFRSISKCCIQSTMKRKLFLLTFLVFINNTVFTQIIDIKAFLDKCPTNDPAITTILNDFEIRLNGVKITEFPCSEPVSLMSVQNYTNPLIYLQTLRVIYYMDKHIVGKHFPWTDKSLYNWMKDNVNGINIKDGVSGGYCCETINGKKFFVTGNANDSNREHDKQWIGISGNIGFFAHEVRHADKGPGHSSCCGIPGGCDDKYDENNLSSYGIQYWLEKNWLDGTLYVGANISHNQSQINEIINWHLTAINNQFRNRFCNNIPDILKISDIIYPLGKIAYLTTSPISGISIDSAISGGNITNDNSASITERGLCWNTTTNPTILNNSVKCGVGKGNFACNLTGLKANTKYYIRSYAKNLFGLAYGNELSFTTPMTSAISEITDSNVFLYPNPTNDKLLINGISEAVKISINDFTGKLVFTSQISSNEFDISNLKNGIYAINIETAKGNITRKFVKH